MRRSLVLVFLLLWVGAGHAYVQPELVYLEGKLSPEEEKIVKKEIGNIKAFYDRIGGPVSVVRISLRLFGSAPEYNSYRNQHTKIQSSTGYHSPKDHEIVVCKSPRFLNTILHESNHVLFRAYFPKGTARTVWINEGLSEYFENLQFNPRQAMSVREPPKKMKRIKKWLTDNMRGRIEKVVSMNRKDWNEHPHDPDHEAYTVSWAMVYFLMARRDGEQIIGAAVRNMMMKKSSKEAIEASYPGGFNTFVSDFVSFYRQ
jgi:hypothetical protein